LFYEPILAWLQSPLATDLYYTTPAGGFNFVMKVAAMTGIALALPVLTYQLIAFIWPAMPKAFSVRRVITYTALSVLLALVGAAFAFYVILPGALHFFTGFQVDGLSALIAADSYLSFVTNVLITFMVVFQIPLLLVIIDRITPIDPKKLLKAEKYVVLGGLVVSFFVPFALDLTTSLLIALPIVLLYTVAIVIVVWRHKLQASARTKQTVEEQQQLALDDAIVAEFFAEASEPVPEEPITGIVGFKGFAMEFQRRRQSSIEELRRDIEEARAQSIAEKVARYNAAAPLRRIVDVR
jgi:sec-independent protein translocase protein TatC